MNNTDAYPPVEFLRDFQEWQLFRNRERDIFERAKSVFSRRYFPDLTTYIYRVNRFICILRVIHKQMPQLIQDRIALSRGGEMDYVPQELLLALHEWYCGVPESGMDAMPDPDWNAVLERYDQLWRKMP
jgi:hypothetical protein